MRAARSGATAGGADFASFRAPAVLSDCARRLAMSLRRPVADFSSASIRASMAGSAAGLPALASTAATRPLSASTVAPVTCGAAGGACTAGQPSIQPTAITIAAATAPENGAIIQGEIDGDTDADATEDRSSAGSGCGSALASSNLAASDLASSDLASSGLTSSDLACSCAACSVAAACGWPATSCGWVETSVASRSMVGGVRLARLDSGANPASSGLSSAIVTVPHTYMP
ncbi:hypothetical protein ACVWWG_002962 [Bradyrhizobium sp. LB7.2]